MGRACPVCRQALRAEKAKMNLEVESCPQHGVFVPGGRVEDVVEDGMVARLKAQYTRGAKGAGCPECGGQMRDTRLGELTGQGCPSCGSIWILSSSLNAYVKAWRQRAYGAGSFAARADVFDETQQVYAGEVISGVLTELGLSLDE